MRVVTADEMRSIDRRTIEGLGLPGVVLMEHAGRTTAAVIEEQVELHDLKDRILVCAYKGNNGGDGFVVARLLANSGYDTEVALFCHPDELTGEARLNYELLEAFPVEVAVYDSSEPAEWSTQFEHQLHGAGVVVDALLGTGITGAVRPPLDRVVELINHHSGPDTRVLAVDLPSGLDADSGNYENVCIQADLTVTMALPKLGLVMYPGRQLAGDIIVADISVPEAFVDELQPERRLLTSAIVAALLPERPADAHKGTFGRAYVVAGSPGFTGAAVLTGIAALRTGAGLVTVGTPEAVHGVLEEKLTEVMTEPLGCDADGRLDVSSLAAITARLRDSDALAVGPGIGRAPGVSSLVTAALEEAAANGVSVVIDADGLNALADSGPPPHGLEQVRSSGVNAVLTPHPGELGRLLGLTPDEIQADRIKHAAAAARLSRAVVVLKGAGTVVVAPEGNMALNTTGNSGLASGGTGDVLTGIIVGLLAQGLQPMGAACAAVYSHGKAADLAVTECGERGLIAGDVVEHLPAVWQELED